DPNHWEHTPSAFPDVVSAATPTECTRPVLCGGHRTQDRCFHISFALPTAARLQPEKGQPAVLPLSGHWKPWQTEVWHRRAIPWLREAGPWNGPGDRGPSFVGRTQLH